MSNPDDIAEQLFHNPSNASPDARAVSIIAPLMVAAQELLNKGATDELLAHATPDQRADVEFVLSITKKVKESTETMQKEDAYKELVKSSFPGTEALNPAEQQSLAFTVMLAQTCIGVYALLRRVFQEDEVKQKVFGMLNGMASEIKQKAEEEAIRKVMEQKPGDLN